MMTDKLALAIGGVMGSAILIGSIIIGVLMRQKTGGGPKILPCIDHGEAIAVLQAEYRHLTKLVTEVRGDVKTILTRMPRGTDERTAP